MVDPDSEYHDKDESCSESDNIPDPLTIETLEDDEAFILQQLFDEESMVKVPAADTPCENIPDPPIVETLGDDEALSEESLPEFTDEDSNTSYRNLCSEVAQNDSSCLDEGERTFPDPAAEQVSIPSVGPQAAAQFSIPPTDPVADQHERLTISMIMQGAEYQKEILTILRGYFPGQTHEQLRAIAYPLIASLHSYCQPSNFNEFRQVLHQSLKHMLFPKEANGCAFSDRSMTQVTGLTASAHSLQSASKKKRKPRAPHYMCRKCGHLKIECPCRKRKEREDVEVQDSSTQTDVSSLRYV
jgi:hypothetical protein